MDSKGDFFRDLYDVSSDEEKIRGPRSQKIRMRRVLQRSESIQFSRVKESNKENAPKPTPLISRSSSPAVMLSLTRSVEARSGNSGGAASIARSPSYQETAPPKLVKSFTYEDMPPKRKRSGRSPLRNEPRKVTESEKVAESLQIFRGLRFFFLPDTGVNQQRFRRIEHAQQYGAEWVSKWIPGVTHIIVDKRDTYDYNAVLRRLEIFDIPSRTALVNENWPIHCVNQKRLIDTTLLQFRVPGHDPAPQPEPTLPPSIARPVDHVPPSSPQIKPKGPEIVFSSSPTHTEGSDELDPSLEAIRLSKEIAARSLLTPRSRDMLDDAIDEAKNTAPISLAESEAETKGESSDDSGVSDSDEPKKRTKFTIAPPSEECPNMDTIEVLQKMYEYNTRVHDQWRSLAYRKAIAALKRHPTKITSKKEAAKVPNIGTRLAEKIEEIVLTGRLRRLDSTALEPNDQALKLFMEIYDVGYKQSILWIAQGHRTLSDLSTNATLTKNQRIGIAHYEDFLTRIPRAEVAQHGTQIRDFCALINPAIEVTIGGSYRRGAPDCGDVDFLFTARDMPVAKLHELIMGDLIRRLWARGYLKCELAVPSKDGTRWRGAGVIPGKTPPVWRRVDFLLVPYEEFGAALIYFTGNDIFNRSIRLLARKKGMRLNEKGLWKDVLRGPGGKKVNEGTLVEARSEKEIFTILGVP